MKKYKVLFFGGGRMGDLAWDTIEKLENVELTRFYVDHIPRYGQMEFDLIFSASYPSRIDQYLIKRTALGAVNIHTSLLPEGRGSNPLNWALIWGKATTGITIHKIVDTYDAGDICMRNVIGISKTDDIVSLRASVEDRFPHVIRTFFENPEHWIKNAFKQNQAHASYAQKRRPEDSELNLNAEPEDIYALFRSCHPVEYPAFVVDNGVKRIVKNVSMDGVITYADE